MKWQVVSHRNIISLAEWMRSGILTSFIPFQLSDLRSLVTSLVQCFPHITVSLMASFLISPPLNYMSFSGTFFMLKACHSSQTVSARYSRAESIRLLIFKNSFLQSKGIFLLSSNTKIKIFLRLYSMFTWNLAFSKSWQPWL